MTDNNEYDDRQIAKIDLWKYDDAKKNIRDLKNKIEIQTSRINSSTSRLKEVSIQSQSKGKEEMIDTLVDLRNLYMQEQADAERIMLNTEIKIGKIEDGLYQRILRNHYLYGQRFEQISMNEKLCYRVIMTCHKRALNEYAWIFIESDPDEYDKIKSERKWEKRAH